MSGAGAIGRAALAALLAATVLAALPAGAGGLIDTWSEPKDDISLIGLVRHGFELKGSALDGGTLVTIWIRPAGTDPVKKDFLGNPLEYAPEMIRCVERQDAQGHFRLASCEIAR